MELTEGTIVLVRCQEEKGATHHYCGEILQYEDGDAKLALFSTTEKFQILDIQYHDRDIWHSGRVTVKFIEPNDHELVSLNRVREQVLPTLAKDALVIKKKKKKKIEATVLQFDGDPLPPSTIKPAKVKATPKPRKAPGAKKKAVKKATPKKRR